MQQNIFLSQITNNAYKVDYNDNLLMSCEYKHANEILSISNEGILKELCSQEAEAVEKHFNINLTDYGVAIIDQEYIL